MVGDSIVGGAMYLFECDEKCVVLFTDGLRHCALKGLLILVHVIGAFRSCAGRGDVDSRRFSPAPAIAAIAGIAAAFVLFVRLVPQIGGTGTHV